MSKQFKSYDDAGRWVKAFFQLPVAILKFLSSIKMPVKKAIYQLLSNKKPPYFNARKKESILNDLQYKALQKLNYG